MTESVSTSKTETSKKESSSESPKIDKKGGSKEAFLGFTDKVSSIKPEDVTNAVKSVTTKENLDKAAELAKDIMNKKRVRKLGEWQRDQASGGTPSLSARR